MVTNPAEYMRKYAKDHYMKYRWSETAKKIRASRNKAHKEMKTPDGMEAHHVDGNPLNTKKSNLRNVTKKYNERH